MNLPLPRPARWHVKIVFKTGTTVEWDSRNVSFDPIAQTMTFDEYPTSTRREIPLGETDSYLITALRPSEPVVTPIAP